MQVGRRRLVSEDEFLRLPESNERVELLDGEVVVSPTPTGWHQELVGRLYVALTAWAEGREPPVSVGLGPYDVRFAPGRILQPDLFVALALKPLDTPGPLERVPELVVEVLSSNAAYDRVTKRLIYAAAGVAEYWVVEPSGLVERWRGAGLAEADELTEALETPLLPGFALDLRGLFRR